MLKFILIFLIVLYAIGFAGRLLLRWWLVRMAKRAEELSKQQYQSYGEGHIQYEKPDQKKKRFDKDDGDYIDFEEVK
jgi:hypothetical protein